MRPNTRIDPLTLAVVRGGLEQATEEMDLTLKRTAFSPVISEGNDLANGCYDAETGEVIVQGKWGLANNLGHVLAHLQYDSIEELHNGLMIISRKNKWGSPRIIVEFASDIYREQRNAHYRHGATGVRQGCAGQAASCGHR